MNAVRRCSLTAAFAMVAILAAGLFCPLKARVEENAEVPKSPDVTTSDSGTYYGPTPEEEAKLAASEPLRTEDWSPKEPETRTLGTQPLENEKEDPIVSGVAPPASEEAERVEAASVKREDAAYSDKEIAAPTPEEETARASKLAASGAPSELSEKQPERETIIPSGTTGMTPAELEKASGEGAAAEAPGTDSEAAPDASTEEPETPKEEVRR